MKKNESISEEITSFCVVTKAPKTQHVRPFFEKKNLKFYLLVVIHFCFTFQITYAFDILSNAEKDDYEFTEEISQSIIKGKVVGLAAGDSATVRIQKSNSQFLFRIIAGSGQDIPFSFENLENGRWALSIDAKGYVFPVAKVLEINNNVFDNTITLVKSDEVDRFSYSWTDDDSYVGHAQQSYVNDEVEIEFLGQKEKVPDNFSAIYLYNQFGFLLSNEEGIWTSEESYRLFQLAQRIPFQRFGEGGPIKPKAKWVITDDFIDKDISYTRVGDADIIRVSRAAFTYATPQVVTVDGVKGKFFSKRLFNALVYYHTDGGFDVGTINNFAQQKYGISFLEPNEFLRNLMGETESNFQIFTPEEKIIIISMLEEFPDAMQRQEGLKYLVRRINGQKHPLYSQAPAIAWTGLSTIEFMEAAFKDVSIEYMQRLVLHEKAHFLWEYTFDQKTKEDWAEKGGWYLEPTSASGWATTNTTEFVTAYAHAINPNEDMAESIAYYITNPEKFRSRSLRKFEFVRDRIMNGTRYISVIRPDLTFEVFNLFPDYNYPGKIIRTKVDVIGGPEEDKTVIIELELKMLDSAFDGASFGTARLVSPIGTIQDMGFNPVNAEGSILRGEVSLSKFAKSGYWNIPQIALYDNVGNARYENNSTYGIKIFVNNPLEDVTAPYYVEKSLKLEKVTGKFTEFSSEMNPNGIEMQAIRLQFELQEKNTFRPSGRVVTGFMFPYLDDHKANQSPPYSKEVQIGAHRVINDFTDSLKNVDFYFPVPDYFPSGYYAISHMLLQDLALNTRQVFFDKDYLNSNLLDGLGNQRSLRDSIYVQTPFPDYKPPVLDLNDIRISATPTIPEAPNGETNFEMKLWIKDESDYPDKASGFLNGHFTLRDPQGAEYGFGIFDVVNFYDVNPDESAKGFKEYIVKALLPAGSPPGIWGVSSITLFDKAGNRKFYSFVEFVRFDVETSQLLQVNPKVEFLDKYVNAKNVEAVSIKIGCEKCKDQNYRIRIYSSMGGNSQVFEGKMSADTIILENLNLKGVNDGVLYATAFILDQEKALIGVGKAEYTKDTVIPKAKSIQSNLSKFGISNLDNLIVEIKTEELEGKYQVKMSQNSTPNPSGRIFNSEVIRTGTFANGELLLSDLPLHEFEDGIVSIAVILIDGAGNESEPIEYMVYKDTKRPDFIIDTILEEGLKIGLNLKVNEYVQGNLDATKLKIQHGELKNITRLDNRNFKLELERDCFQTLKIEFLEGLIVDTVSNFNLKKDQLFEKEWAPRIKTKNLTVELNENGKFILNPADFNDGSVGYCGDLTFEISKNNLDCSDLGVQKLIVTATDVNGRKFSSDVEVTVKEKISPLIRTKSNVILKLNEDGKISIKPEDLDNGTVDNCTIKELKVSKSSFDCSNLGANKITFTATDASGNSSTSEVEVTILDEEKPQIKAKSSYTHQLDREGKGTLKWEDLDEGSFDNCNIKERKLSRTDFSKSDAGENKITYTIIDASGNTANVEINIKVDIILSTPERTIEENTISVFPNPASDLLKIKFLNEINFNSIIIFEVFDTSGKLIEQNNHLNLGENTVGLTTSKLKTGLYLLRIGTRESVFSLKFTIKK